MEKFIEKMEALLRSNTKGFMGILLLLTVFGLGIYFVVSFCLRGKIDEKYDELLKLYVENASWMLFVAGILWIILLGTQQENKE